MTLFFSAVMYGRIVPGGDEFGEFLLTHYGTSSTEELYIRLMYCPAAAAYDIPSYIVDRCDCFSRQRNEIYKVRKREKELEYVKSLEHIEKNYQTDLDKRAAERKKYFDKRRMCMLQEIERGRPFIREWDERSGNELHSKWDDDAVSIISLFVMLETYEKVRSCLLPFYTARFTPFWRNASNVNDTLYGLWAGLATQRTIETIRT